MSDRARNGLERAGLVQVEDLLSLPPNHLSAVRGVSRKVAQEILSFRDRWQQTARSVETRSARPFLEAYAGANLPVSQCDDLPSSLAQALNDGALKTLAQVAAAPTPRVEALCFAAQVKPKLLVDVLRREMRRAREAKLPTSIERWLSVLGGG